MQVPAPGSPDFTASAERRLGDYYFEMSQTASSEEKTFYYSKAILFFTQDLNVCQGDSKTWKKLVKCLSAQKKYEEIKKTCDSALQIFPQKKYFLLKKIKSESELHAKQSGFPSFQCYEAILDTLHDFGCNLFKKAKLTKGWHKVYGVFLQYQSVEWKNFASLAALGVCCHRASLFNCSARIFRFLSHSFPLLKNLNNTESDERPFVKTVFKLKQFIIRPACRQDLKFINHLHLQICTEDFSFNHSNLSSSINRSGVSQYCEETTIEEVFVLQLPHSLKPKGFMVLRFFRINTIGRKENCCVLKAIAISQKYRKMGLGDCLMLFVKQRARDNECQYIELECSKAPLSFYLKHKFVPAKGYLKQMGFNSELEWQLASEKIKIDSLTDKIPVDEIIEMKLDLQFQGF